jgi:hypothetical protein
MPSLNIFEDDAFSVVSMTAAINDIPYVPDRITRLGLFTEEGVTTTTIYVERMGQTLALVPATPRGGPPPTPPRDRASLIPIPAVRLAEQDAVIADEVQNVRAFGTESTLRTVQQLVTQRQARIALMLDMTLEFHALGAIKGQVLDANGTSVLLNLYDVFGLAQQAEIDFDLDNATPAAGALMRKFNDMRRKMEDAMGGVPFQRIHAFAGPKWMDDLFAHKEYRDTFQAVNAAMLRESNVRMAVNYQGVTIEEYRGTVGGVQYVGDDKAIFFPVGSPGMFRRYFAPADYEETVNTLGLPRYSKQWGDGGPNRRRQIEGQSNPITINTRPNAVIFARRT